MGIYLEGSTMTTRAASPSALYELRISPGHCDENAMRTRDFLFQIATWSRDYVSKYYTVLWNLAKEDRSRSHVIY